MYEKHEPDSIRFGRLTTATSASEKEASASTGAAPVQPKLVAHDIPMLPGLYIQFYQNVGQTIRDVEAARSAKSEVAKALENLFVKPVHIVQNTQCLLLARKSAREGRTVSWDEL